MSSMRSAMSPMRMTAPSVRGFCGEFPYNFHALRHYYASVMLMNGIPNRYARERMGHATEDMLIKVYQHTMDSKQREYDTVLDDFFTETLTTETE